MHQVCFEFCCCCQLLLPQVWWRLPLLMHVAPTLMWEQYKRCTLAASHAYFDAAAAAPVLLPQVSWPLIQLTHRAQTPMLEQCTQCTWIWQT
jgi:hypothetical protein